jgi:hypothetical protein
MNPFQHPDNPVEFYRDSRHAFGHRFTVEKAPRDWLWMVGAIILVAAFAVGYFSA